ncbi:MAG: hypothetical protein WC533_02065 [Candidatus Pacearchaeota archaeon]
MEGRKQYTIYTSKPKAEEALKELRDNVAKFLSERRLIFGGQAQVLPITCADEGSVIRYLAYQTVTYELPKERRICGHEPW